ncbi:prolactin-releasing peptide receptor-like [Actinia tenebrosa]|uniref:Prolactin-releasing peptide receptor-like n=1 Tax=Actinia tenebrosa TaxID=6105 RepID=A0A6P8H8V1_ACTTE|nr:prolactin-releasing peptide receptor-like [Actinia tenebrosa]
MEPKSNSTTKGDDDNYSKEFVIGTVVCLTIAAFVGLIGNGLLVIMITKARKLQSVMNRFILHLAIGDLIVCVICIPLFLAINFYFQKNNQEWICKLSRFLQYLAPQGSMMLLITIGINRHQAIVHPLRAMTYSTANRFIFGAWLYSLIVVSPSIYLTKVQHHINPSTNITEPYCATIPVSTKPGLMYVLALAVLGYFIPLTTLVVLYTKISYAVWRRDNKNNTQMRTSRPAKAMMRSRKKVIKMFLTVIVVFVITWLPLIIYIGGLENYLYKTSPRISRVRLIVYSIGLSNSIYNPFIYSFFNKKFREGCKGIFRSSFLFIKNPMMKREGANDSPKTVRGGVSLSANNTPRLDQKFSKDKEWQIKYSVEAVRGHNEEIVMIDSKHNVKLIDLKSTGDHTNIDHNGSDFDQQNYGMTHSPTIAAIHNTDEKQVENTNTDSRTRPITTEIPPTPQHTRPQGRTRRTNKKKLFKNLSERTLAIRKPSSREGKPTQKPKLRKVMSAFPTGTKGSELEDDFDSLF